MRVSGPEECEQVLVVGCGGHARFVLSMISSSAFSAAGLIDLRVDFNPEEVIMGCPVIGSDSQLAKLRERFGKAVMAVGDNDKRKALYRQMVELGFAFPNIVHSSAFVDTSCRLGQGNIVGPNAVIGAEVCIGDNNIVNSAAVIEHQSIIGSHCHIAPGATLCGAVNVSDDVLLGANCTVLAQVSIAQGTILGAGSTLVRSQARPGKTLVGSPAREIST